MVLIIGLLGTVAGTASGVRVYCLSYNGVFLTTRLRKLSLQAMLRQVL